MEVKDGSLQEMMELKYFELKSPLTAQLELTDRCQNRCSFCYNSSRYVSTTNQEIDQKQIYQVLDKLLDGEVFEVVVTGGEPFIRKDNVFAILNYLSAKPIEVKINSNLYSVSKGDVKKLKLFYPYPLKGMLTTLLSHKESTHNKLSQNNVSYRNLLTALECIVKEEIMVGVNMVVTKENIGDIYDTGRFLLEQFGVDHFSATPISISDSSHFGFQLNQGEVHCLLDALLSLKESGVKVDILEPIPLCLISNWKKYVSLLRRDCSAGRTTVAISPQGEVRPCTHISIGYGNLLREDLFTIWQRMSSWRDTSFVPSKCQKCKGLAYCSTGCRYSAYIHNGEFNSEDPLTEYLNPLKSFASTSSFSIEESSKRWYVKPFKHRKEKDKVFSLIYSDYSFLLVTEPLFELLQKYNSKIVPKEVLEQDLGISFRRPEEIALTLLQSQAVEQIGGGQNV